jgi:hypothetical protein
VEELQEAEALPAIFEGPLGGRGTIEVRIDGLL